jgi:triosephosphate isomerase (TIM)
VKPLDEREAGTMNEVVGGQLRGSLTGLSPDQILETIIAYEPVWAIGTGRTATADQAQEVHAFIRAQLAALFGDAVAKRVRIQYGGSVKPSNTRELMSQPDVDGALVGGASLEVRSFSEIVRNCI